MEKILIFSTAYMPHIGGAEVAVYEITKRLAGRFGFILITYRFDRSLPKNENINGVEVWRLGFGTKLDRWFIFPFLACVKGWQLQRLHRIRILWAIMVSYASIGACLLKIFKPRLRLLLTLQEGDSEQHLTFGKGGMLGLWWGILARRADRVSAISTYLARRAAKWGAKGEIAIVPNGVDFEHFSKIPDPAGQDLLRESLGLSSSDIVVTTVSRLVFKNAVDTSIQAFKFLEPNYKFLVLGEGEERPALEKLAKEEGLEQRVIFLETISHKLLPQYLRLASVFVRPSRSEGLGNVFLESMASGVPMVATPVGGITDFLKDKITGLFCRPNDPKDLAEKIKLLATDNRLSHQVSENARKLVAEQYSWSPIAAAMEKIFKEL